MEPSLHWDYQHTLAELSRVFNEFSYEAIPELPRIGTGIMLTLLAGVRWQQMWHWHYLKPVAVTQGPDSIPCLWN